jgi:pilus assembly protein Flp/PilA
MDPTQRWVTSAIRRLRGVGQYDAYPDHETPFEVAGRIGQTVPVSPVARRIPIRRQHPVSLFVKRKGRMREVKLVGQPLEIAMSVLNRRLVAGWVMHEIAATLEQMEEDEVSLEHHRPNDNKRGRKGQGLAEYALILALIAIVAIAALLLLGGQIQDALNSIGESILPQ